MLSVGSYPLRSRYMLAPMAGVSEQPFRVLAFEMGAGLCPSELVSAQGLFRLSVRTLNYLRHDPRVERPFSLQLFGGEPDVLARAAVIAKTHGAQIIDINMGCPVKKVTRGGSGSALLCDPPRAAAIVQSIRDATGLPVTAKIRSGWDDANKNYLRVASELVHAGAVAIACHPRTRAQGYAGRADWRVLADLKRELGTSALVIGNGDVQTPADAARMLAETDCDAVMIGRGALGNPWIFRQLHGGAAPKVPERWALVLRHFQDHLAFRCQEPTQARAETAAIHAFRKHLGWYSHGLPGAAHFRASVTTLETKVAVIQAIDAFFGGLPDDLEPRSDTPAEVDYHTALG